MTMRELIERLEKTSEGSMALNIAIAQALPVEGQRVNDDGSVDDWTDGSDFGHGWYPAPVDLPDWSRSIDAALTLVPEGWVRTVDATAPYAGVEVDLFGPDDTLVTGTHENEAIATCIASLRARLALASDGDTQT